MTVPSDAACTQQAQPAWRPTRALLRLSGGAAALLLGGTVYEYARPAGFHGGLLDALPSFAHVVAMVLVSGALLQPGRGAGALLCVGWVAVNTLFEIGQAHGLAVWIAAWLDDSCRVWGACQATARFFLHGTFDPLDLAASTAGGFVAWRLLRLSDEKSAVRK